MIARQTTILEARRHVEMNLIALDDDGRIVKIAPNGTEIDMTAELDRQISETTGRKHPPPP